MKKTKKFNYFENLVTMAEFSLKEAHLLKETFLNFAAETLHDKQLEMHTLEHDCDRIKHGLISALIHEFLPPIEREDLFTLSHVVDDLADKVESVIIFLYMANITKLREDAMDFVDLIIECCEEVVSALKEFANFKKSTTLKDLLIKINDLEEKGDHLYIQAVRNLSCSDADTRTIIEWRDIYRCFEACFDAAEKIADTVQSAVMKNA